MNTLFFSLDENQKKLRKIYESIKTISSNDSFSNERNKNIIILLQTFISEARSWDEYTQYNISKIGSNFISSDIKTNSLKDELDEFFSDCFRFHIERYLSQDENPNIEFVSINGFAIENKEKFSAIASVQISYALNSMPIDVFKNNTKNINIGLVKDFIKTHEDCKTLKAGWDSDFTQRITEIKQLKDSLDEQKNAFNFVGLYKGFDDLSEEKKNEKTTASNILMTLGGVIFIPIILEVLFILYKGDALTLPHALITSIPLTSLLFILIYFFRIALHDYKSIKTQINQIELRKSLCKFIQNYAKYSSEIKKDDASALDKFETIIFSNIVMTDEKLPSTFDGIESVANLIKSVKG